MPRFIKSQGGSNNDSKYIVDSIRPRFSFTGGGLNVGVLFGFLLIIIIVVIIAGIHASINVSQRKKL